MTTGERDRQTVRADGSAVMDTIAGVRVRYSTSHLDERGELCEIYNPAWDFTEEPLVYAYQIVVRPGKIKGWVYHAEQDDRLFASMGTVRIVLYDPREDSPTKGRIDEIFLGERRRGLLRIPKLVVHAVENIGITDAVLINLPTRAYAHNRPDKFRIALNSDQIPFRFEQASGR